MMPSVSSGVPPVRLVPHLPSAFFGNTPKFQGKESNVTKSLSGARGVGTSYAEGVPVHDHVMDISVNA